MFIGLSLISHSPDSINVRGKGPKVPRSLFPAPDPDGSARNERREDGGTRGLLDGGRVAAPLATSAVRFVRVYLQTPDKSKYPAVAPLYKQHDHCWN